jgi:uncharacterized GH25 family protein
MKLTGTSGFCAMLGWLMLPTLALAHEFWVMPDSFNTTVGHAPTLQLRVGAGWPGEVHAPEPARTLRWDWVDAQGTQSLRAIRPRPVQARAPGWALAIYRSNHAQISLSPQDFEAYLREEGLEQVIETRRLRGDSMAPGREIYSRCAKALVRVEHARGASRARPKRDLQPRLATQLDLEILPLTDPRSVPSGGPFQFELRWHGRPLRAALLRAYAQHGEAAPMQSRSDNKGRVTLNLPKAGVWLINTVHMRPAPKRSGADWESTWSSLTLQLGHTAP